MKNLVMHFGFKDTGDFLSSTIHVKFLILSIPVATISAFIDQYFGLSLVTALSFTILLTLELVTGLLASLVKKRKLESRRLARFGLKIFVWFSLFFIIQSFKAHFADKFIVAKVYDWAFSVVIIYVTFEYMISVLENIATITGRSESKLIKALKSKLNNILNVED